MTKGLLLPIEAKNGTNNKVPSPIN